VLGRHLGEGEDGQRRVARALRPVLGVEHELGVARVRGHLQQEVVDAAGARREHGVAASVELVVDDLVVGVARDLAGRGDVRAADAGL